MTVDVRRVFVARPESTLEEAVNIAFHRALYGNGLAW